MGRKFISEMSAGDRIEDQVFLINSKDLRTTNQGGLYIHAVLADRTGQLLARLWQASEEIYADIPEGGFLHLKGRVESYKGSLQFIIDALRPVEDIDTVNLGDFLPRTDGDIDAMWARLTEILGGIKNEYVAALIGQFLADEQLSKRIKTAPAATQLHHAYIGGLLEHTLSLLELALVTIPKYPDVSLDLVLAGVFLHDIAKTAELKYETNIGYSDGGQLVGHVAMGTVWIELKAAAAARELDKPFPNDIKWVLQHIVLAHHGKYEFGAPKLPAIPEAAAIHFLDNLDAKLNMMTQAIKKDPDSQSTWTQYIRALETKVYKPAVLNDRPTSQPS